MDHRFSEGSNIVFDCFSCLDPKNLFSKFDADKFAHLADIYHADFSDGGRGTTRERLGPYKLIELALIFSVLTASVERAFSAMKIIKTKLPEDQRCVVQ
ncbi:hypothetical protein MTR_2g084485 [Medicago truncatula]|uniref:HAT C-terminal dimerisation domain-containing protein n=1 Tax=Medicago truncatula TaxID=3880 RepID=A0A072VAW8_MEDTR|nr:hypothetical protein MTR_2g084485 [Medicago truncatula]